jgi:hypothetical protein
MKGPNKLPKFLSTAFLFEKRLHNSSALFRHHTTCDLSFLTQQMLVYAGKSGFGLFCSKHNFVKSGPLNGTGAHQARFNGNVKGAFI